MCAFKEVHMIISLSQWRSHQLEKAGLRSDVLDSNPRDYHDPNPRDYIRGFIANGGNPLRNRWPQKMVRNFLSPEMNITMMRSRVVGRPTFP